MSTNQNPTEFAPGSQKEREAILQVSSKARQLAQEHCTELNAAFPGLTVKLKSNLPDNFLPALAQAEEWLEAKIIGIARAEELLKEADDILNGEFGKRVRKQVKNATWISHLVNMPAKKIRNVEALQKAVNILRKAEAKAGRGAETVVEIKEEAPVAETPVEAPVEAVQPGDSVDIEELMRAELSPGRDKPHKPGYARSRSDRGRGRGHSRKARGH